MKRECPYCKSLNDLDAEKCFKCGEVVISGREVYPSVSDNGGAISFKEKIDGSPTEEIDSGAICQCKYPQFKPGADICFACDKPIGNRSIQSSEGALIAAAASHRLKLLGIGDCAISVGQGLLIGRDQIYANSQIAASLAGYSGVSRRHLWIGRINDDVVLLDLGSKNGTWQGKERLVPFIPMRAPAASLPLDIWIGGKLKITISKEAK